MADWIVGRCFCEQRATRPCACCGRARCETHLERDLCNRCTQAVGRAADEDAGRTWVVGGVACAVVSLGLLAAGSIASVLVGLPFGISFAFAWRDIRRRQAIRLLGPKMSASTGELPPLPREPTYGRPDDTLPPGCL